MSLVAVAWAGMGRHTSLKSFSFELEASPLYVNHMADRLDMKRGAARAACHRRLKNLLVVGTTDCDTLTGTYYIPILPRPQTILRRMPVGCDKAVDVQRRITAVSHCSMNI